MPYFLILRARVEWSILRGLAAFAVENGFADSQQLASVFDLVDDGGGFLALDDLQNDRPVEKTRFNEVLDIFFEYLLSGETVQFFHGGVDLENIALAVGNPKAVAGRFQGQVEIFGYIRISQLVLCL